MQRPRNALVELHAHVRALLPGETAVSTSNKLFRENRSPVLIHKLACCAPPRLLPTAFSWPSLHFPNKPASTYAQRAGLNLDQMQTRPRTHASSYTLQTPTHARHSDEHMTWCILTNSSETTAPLHILTYRAPAPS
jgi:hypothetical protein